MAIDSLHMQVRREKQVRATPSRIRFSLHPRQPHRRDADHRQPRAVLCSAALKQHSIAHRQRESALSERHRREKRWRVREGKKFSPARIFGKNRRRRPVTAADRPPRDTAPHQFGHARHLDRTHIVPQGRVEHAALAVLECKGHRVILTGQFRARRGQQLHRLIARQTRIKLVIGLKIPHFSRNRVLWINNLHHKRPARVVRGMVPHFARQVGKLGPVLECAAREMENDQSFSLFNKFNQILRAAASWGSGA